MKTIKTILSSELLKIISDKHLCPVCLVPLIQAWNSNDPLELNCSDCPVGFRALIWSGEWSSGPQESISFVLLQDRLRIHINLTRRITKIIQLYLPYTELLYLNQIVPFTFNLAALRERVNLLLTFT